ncbi:MAG: hypothetical protein OXG84_09815 [Chloroflexi bacterium]|nr:hypothetical protein [Chloroflexota bacterium]
MTTVPKRLGVKFSLKQQPTLQPEDILPIFQRWIQEHAIEGMLIDVIDYKHMPDGPGIVLIADEFDLAYDLADGEIGLYYIRKRNLPESLDDSLRLVISRTLAAARALEAEAPSDIVFDYRSVKISFLDRIHYRNEPEIFEAVRRTLSETLSEVFGADIVITRMYDDPRAIFALRCISDCANVDADALLARLDASRQSV